MINLFKLHKKPILITTISILSVVILSIFITICILYFHNISTASFENTYETQLFSAIITNSNDSIAFAISSKAETLQVVSEEQKQEDTEKDKEEEKKAEEEEKKELEKNKNSTNKQSTPSYYIKVNRAANTVTVYTKDANGNYTVPVKSMVCSTRICISY